jgi:F0F1-type ATP synthase membrane subunit a
VFWCNSRTDFCLQFLVGIQREKLQLLFFFFFFFSLQKSFRGSKKGFVSSCNFRTDFVYNSVSGNSKKKSSTAYALLLLLLLLVAEAVEKIIKKVM